MSTDTPTNDNQTPTSETKSLGDADLSFTDYQKIRRGETVLVSSPKKSAPEPKAQEQKKSVASDPAETEEVEDDQDDVDPGSQEGEVKDDVSNKDKPKKKGGYQKRIDKLNARTHKAQQEAEYWKSLVLKEKETSEKPTQKVDAPKSQDGEPDPDKFDTHAEYVKAVARWEIKQEQKAQTAAAEKSRLETEHESLNRSHRERVKSFAEKNPDFDEVLAEVEDVKISAAFQGVILESQNGPELMYELAKNRDEFERIAKLSPLAAAKELGKLEAKIASSLSSEEQKQEPKKITKAPKPIDPIGSGNSAIKKSIADPDLSFTDYVRLRREQQKRKHG